MYILYIIYCIYIQVREFASDALDRLLDGAAAGWPLRVPVAARLLAATCADAVRRRSFVLYYYIILYYIIL